MVVHTSHTTRSRGLHIARQCEQKKIEDIFLHKISQAPLSSSKMIDVETSMLLFDIFFRRFRRRVAPTPTPMPTPTPTPTLSWVRVSVVASTRSKFRPSESRSEFFFVARNGWSVDGHRIRLDGFQEDFDPTGSSKLFQTTLATKIFNKI